MRRHLGLAVWSLSLLSIPSPDPLHAQTTPNTDIQVARRSDWSQQPKYKSDQILVRFRQGTQPQRMEFAHGILRARSLKAWAGLVDGLQLVQLPDGMSLQDALQAYAQNPDVLYVEPNYIVHAFDVTDDPSFQQLWGLRNTGQYGGSAGADIRISEAWTQTTGSANVVLAVLDTGIDYDHPDLASNVWSSPTGYSGIINGRTINCAAGTHGLNAITGVCDPFDDNGHGTHVSGTIGAVGNNNMGVAGVNWTVKVMSCKFLDAFGSGTVSDAITCLDFVKAMKEQGANVVATNNSWGGFDFSQALADAIQPQQQSGILFIASSGNEGENTDITPVYPAGYFLPNVISVAATTRLDQLAYFSNVGLHSVHLGAPGQEILSTVPRSNYAVLNGTSMAAPHVAGVAALLAARYPGIDWHSIRNRILAGGDTLPGLGVTITGKRLNAYGAIACNDSQLTKRLQPTKQVLAGAAGQAITLAVLNINCAQPAGPVQVTVSPGGQAIALLDDGSGADQAAGDGTYTVQWTPAGAGNYVLGFPGGDLVQVTVLSNYTVGQSNPNYQAIGGTSLDLSDDDVVTLDAPFAVQFGGGSFTSLYVGSNGTISFTNAFSDFVHQALPINYLRLINPINPLPNPINRPVTTLLAPLWQDLVPIRGTNQNVFWDVLGTAPNRQLVVEWRNVRTYSCRDDGNATVKFQVVFSESSSDVYFNYADVIVGGVCSGQDLGSGATVGLQITQDVGTQWSNDDHTLADGTSLIWKLPSSNPVANPVPTITSISPSSIPFGSGYNAVTVNGTGFVPGSRVTSAPSGDDLYPTVYLSNTQMQFVVKAADDQSPLGGTGLIQVRNPLPGGGTSQSVVLDVVGESPQITAISPSTVPSGGFGFVLTINGSRFVEGSNVWWNGADPGTIETFVSSNQLTLPVPAYFVQNVGTVTLQVQHPNNGGGRISNTVQFTITPAVGTNSFPGSNVSSSGAATDPPDANTRGRFLGWKIAQQIGGGYLNQFLRPRANLARPPLGNSLSFSTTEDTGDAHLSGVPPPVAGFNLRPTLPADFIPTAVATGDFNRDGSMDWAVANGGSNNIWIYIGKADGTSELPRVVLLRGMAPVALVTADMNGDTKLDLVVAEADSTMVGVLLGVGDGTFGPELLFVSPDVPISLSVADFDGDGNLDVVAGLFSNYYSGQLAFFPGDGTGKLGIPVVHYSFERPFDLYTNHVGAADLDNDGRLDIVAVDFSNSPFLSSSGARAYINQGGGTFKLAQQFFFFNNPVGSNTTATAAALGDVNQDGCIDAVTLDTDGKATFFPGLCNGQFDVYNRRIFGAGIVAGTAILADFDGDNDLDLLSAGFPRTGSSDGSSISVQLGDGTGNFGPPKLYFGEPGMFSLGATDLNGDGRIDVVTANQWTDTASVYLNDGQGKFGGPGGGYLGYLTAGEMDAVATAPIVDFPAVVDINGDGNPDLVTIESGARYPMPVVLAVLLGDGAGQFGLPVRSPILDASSEVRAVVLEDFRNSGQRDLLFLVNGIAVNSQASLGFARSNGDGTFQRPVLTQLSGIGTALVPGDFNNDGKLDAVAVTFTSIIPMLGGGDGIFTPGTAVTLSLGRVFAGDFNRDGKLDLLGLISGALYEVFGNGNGTFQAPALILSSFPPNFTMADLNHDGAPDIVAAVRRPSSSLWDYSIFLGQPDGTFAPQAGYGPFLDAFFTGSLTLAQFASQPYVADFNGDGNLDVAVLQAPSSAVTNFNGPFANPPGTTAQILAGNGDGTFGVTNIGFNFVERPPQTAADISGDGRADWVETNRYASSFNVIAAESGPSFAIALVTDPIVGNRGKLRLTLAYASSAETTLQLSVSDPAISISPSVSFPPGSVSQDIEFQFGSSFDPSRVFTLTAQLGSETHTAYGRKAAPLESAGFGTFLPIVPPSVILPSQSTPANQIFVTSLAGYSATIQFSCEGLPAGASCLFDSTSATLLPGFQIQNAVRVATPSNIPGGQYQYTVVVADDYIASRTPSSFKIGDFTLSLTPPSQTIGPTGSATYTVSSQGVNGYSGQVLITCPASAPLTQACSLNGLTINANSLGTFSVNAGSAPTGNYTITLTGTSGPLVRVASTQLTISTSLFAGSLSSTSATINAGTSQTFEVRLDSINNFQGSVGLSCSNATSNVSCQFNPTQISVNPSSQVTALLTVSVKAKGAAMPFQPGVDVRHLHMPLLFTVFAIVLSTVVLSLNGRNRPTGRYASIAGTSLALLLFLAAFQLTSCAGGGGGGGPTGGGGSTGFGSGGTGPTSVQLVIQGSSGGVTSALSTLNLTIP